jgi:hypothetical protein
MSNPHVISQRQLLHSNDYVQVSDLRVIANLANTGFKNAESDSHTLSHSVSKEKPVTRALQK